MKEFELPTSKSKPKANLKDYFILLYGRAKTGKTTLAAQFEDPLFLMFEPGSKSLEIFQKDMVSWKTFKNAVVKLGEEKERFKTVVIDTIDSAYEMCLEYVCSEQGVDHPSDGAYGKVWNAVDNEFSAVLSKLGKQGRGVLFISHVKDKDIEQPDGSVKEMTGPSLSNQGMKWVDRNVDVFAYYFYGKNSKRYIRIKGTDTVVAGCRIDNHFKGISRIYAGNSPQEAYANLVAAFQNKEVKGE